MDIIHNRKLKTEVLPGADRSIVIDRAIRSSGLLACLSPENLQTLIAILTFADVSGKCNLSAGTIGQTLNLSENQARKRLKRLCDIRWRGKLLVVKEFKRDDGKFGMAFYRLMKIDGIRLSSDDHRETKSMGKSNNLVKGELPSGYHSEAKGLMDERNSSRNGSKHNGLREAEATVVQEGEVIQLGCPSGSERPAITVGDTPVSCVNNNINKHTTMKNTVTKNAYWSLVDAGVSKPIASRLVEDYPAETIARQLRMLPYRNAREPAAMLVKAIKEDWSAPSAYAAAMRNKAIMQEKKDAESLERMRREALLQQIETAISKLSSAELQEIRAKAYQAVKAALKGALGGAVPQRLVDAQIKKIVSEKYIKK